jgi:hypothetical protein
MRTDDKVSSDPVHSLPRKSNKTRTLASSFTCHREEIGAALLEKTSYHDPISSVVASRKSTTKRVQFMVDPCDVQSVQCCIHLNDIELTADEVQDSWYRSAEIKQMRREMYSEALVVRESTSSTYTQQFHELCSSCDKSLSVVSLPYQLAKTVAESEYRGYESLIFLEVLRLKQQDIILEVLSTQEHLRRTCTFEQLSTELYTVSTGLTERSRRLAFMMGIGDANVASQHVTSSERENALFIKNRICNVHCCQIKPLREAARTSEIVISTSRYEL